MLGFRWSHIWSPLKGMIYSPFFPICPGAYVYPYNSLASFLEVWFLNGEWDKATVRLERRMGWCRLAAALSSTNLSQLWNQSKAHKYYTHTQTRGLIFIQTEYSTIRKLQVAYNLWSSTHFSGKCSFMIPTSYYLNKIKSIFLSNSCRNIPCLVKTESGNSMPFKFLLGNFYSGHSKTESPNENSINYKDSAQFWTGSILQRH